MLVLLCFVVERQFFGVGVLPSGCASGVAEVGRTSECYWWGFRSRTGSTWNGGRPVVGSVS